MKKILLCAACLVLPGWLPAQAQTDPALQQHMIWTEAAPQSEGDPVFAAFRKTFTLATPPKAAELRIFAGLRYLLWINGRYVLRGPVRFDPKAPQFDVLDIATYLQPGRNSLAVMVLGRARNNAMMRHVPGLTAELRLIDPSCKTAILETDETWRCNDKTSYQTPVLKYNQGTWSDRVDARILGDAWTKSDFNDSAWKVARKTDSSAWGPMRPRTMALLSETPVPATPIGAGACPVEIPEGKTVVFDAGRQTYLSSGSYGCRYVAVTAVKGSATIHDVALMDRRYPFKNAGSFTCSDPFLNELWKRAVHTVRICSEDGYLDSALREQNQWMGDAAVAGYPVARVTLAGPGEPLRSDAELMKNVLRHIEQSQLSDGRLLAHHPSQSVDIHAYIEDYSCL